MSTSTPAGPERRGAVGVDGLLADFQDADIVTPADARVGRTWRDIALAAGRAGGSPAEDEQFELAVALAVRALREGSTCLELDRAAQQFPPMATPFEQSAAVTAAPARDWPQLEDWRAVLQGHPMVSEPVVGTIDRPLLLDGDRCYLTRFWQAEQVVRSALLTGDGDGAAIFAPVTDAERARGELDRLFGSDGVADPQRAAAAVAAGRRVSIVAGGPGTGKTYTVARIVALLLACADDRHPRVTRVALAAPTGKAAARMGEALDEALAGMPDEDVARIGELRAQTLHRLLGARGGPRRGFRFGPSNPLLADVVIVDEASMVSLELMAHLVTALPPHGRLVLVGDPDQLGPIQAGAVLGDVAAAPGRAEVDLVDWMERTSPREAASPIVHGVVRLTRNRRFGGRLADLSAAVRDGDEQRAVDLLGDGAPDGIEWIDDDPALLSADSTRWAALRQEVVDTRRAVARHAADGDVPAALGASEAHRLICGHRGGPYGVAGWTRWMRLWLRQAGAAEASGAVALAAVDDLATVGTLVLVTGNDYGAGIFNGDVGVTVQTPAGVKIGFAQLGEVELFNPTRLSDVQPLEAMTVHRAQGSQYDAVTVVLPPTGSPLLNRGLLYTALTRAKSRVRLIGTEAAVREAVATGVLRASGLRG